MGQKVHPYGFRIGTLYGWQSNWFAERKYCEQLHEDLRIRNLDVLIRPMNALVALREIVTPQMVAFIADQSKGDS